MDIDSYQPATEAHLPPRKRRPWWRWNLITLAIVLFVLLWTRELLQFDPSSVWLSAGTIIFLWTIIPVPKATSLFTTMPDYSKQVPRRRGGKRKILVVACRWLALLLAVTSVGYVVLQLYWILFSNPFGRSRMPGINLFVFLQLLVQSLYQLAIAAVLWFLTEAIEKLDHVMKELGVQAERQGKESGG